MFSMRGESYLYTIDQKGNKYFSATPTVVDLDGLMTTFLVRSPTHLRNQEYTKLSDHNYPTLKYTIGESSAGGVYSLFSPHFEAEIKAKDYLGAFGTGYYEDFYGNTIISLALDSNPDNIISINKIVDVAECFNGSSFVDQITQAIDTENQIIERNQQRLDEKTFASDAPCVSKTRLLNLEKEMLIKEKKASNLLKPNGGKYSERELEILAKGNDVKDQALKSKYEAEIKVCNLMASNNRIDMLPENKIRNVTKINCLNNVVRELNILIDELDEIDNGVGTQSKKMLEKNKLYYARMNTIKLGCR